VPSGQFQGVVISFHGSSTGWWADTTAAVQLGKEKMEQEILRKHEQKLMK